MKNQALILDEKALTDPTATADQKPPKKKEAPLVLEEVHLEKITIDGICGVY